MKTIYTVVILLGLCNPLAAQTYGSHSETVMYTSICKILTNSDHFNGRIVGVFGVLKTGRGLGLLFLTKEHASWNDLANAVDIIPDGRVLHIDSGTPEWAALNGRAVYVEGRLSARASQDEDKPSSKISITFVEAIKCAGPN